MSGSPREYNQMKISRSLINSLGQPDAEAMLQIERSLDRMAQPSDVNARGLLLNLCRQLISASGDALSVSKDKVVSKLQPNYTEAQISSVVDQLQSRGLVLVNDGQLKLSSGILSKLIHAKIQAETAGQQKIEAFIANRYDYYLEKGQLLSEQDINYITPFMGEVVLPSEQHQFIEVSRKAIANYKRRRFVLLAALITILALLSVVAIFFAIRSSNEENKARIEESNAKAKEMEATIAAAKAQKAQKEASDARDTLQQVVVEREVANRQIQDLLMKETNKSNALRIAQQLTEEQRRIATERALEIEKLNKDLNLYAEDKEREAQAALDAEAEATEARKASDELRKTSDKLRYILLSRIVAQRSLGLKDSDKDLKAYTAMLAYQINSTTPYGDVLHPDVFRAVYYAARNQNSTSISPSVDIAGGAIGGFEWQYPSVCLSGASDGSVVQFRIDPISGIVQDQKRIFYLPHDAIRFVFPQANENGTLATAFVLGAFDHILEITLPGLPDSRSGNSTQGGTATSAEIRQFPLPDRHFVKEAFRTDDDQLMIQTTDGALYEFDCHTGELKPLLSASDGAVAWTALSHLGLVCYATAQNELILTDRKQSTEVVYATAKKRVAQMQLKQYGTAIYLALAYTDGELEVFISNKDAFLSAYQSQLQGKSYYQIQSLRSSVHTGYIPAIVFADSRPLLAVCSYDGTLSVWDLKAWEERSGDYQPLILDDQDDWVTACAFLPGDKTLLSGSKLGTVKYWNLDPAVYASGLCAQINRVPNDEEWREYIGDELKSFKESVCREKQ